MHMKTLNVPTSNISALKKSPKSVFEKAEMAGTGVYVFNRDTPVGVVLSINDYETLVKENEQLQNRLVELEATNRLNTSHKLLSDSEVRGAAKANAIPKLDPNDGWD